MRGCGSVDECSIGHLSLTHSPTWRQIADSSEAICYLFLARKFSFSELYESARTYFFEEGLRRASTRKGGHRSTRDRVLTWRERH